MERILVKWMRSSEYGDFEDGKKTLDVPEGAAAKDKVLEFFRSPNFAYNGAGAFADGVCFNAYRVPASGTAPAFMDGGTYEYNEIEWAGRELDI